MTKVRSIVARFERTRTVQFEHAPRFALRFIVLLLLSTCAGCEIDLPAHEVPQNFTPGYSDIDPRPMCGVDKPVHVGATRKGVDAAFGSDMYRRWPHPDTETFTIVMDAGRYFFLGLDIETGALFGLYHRYVTYGVTIVFDSADRVKDYHLTRVVGHDPHS